MVSKFNGDNAANARIKIDYSKKKPQVKFTYPDLKNQEQGSMLFYILIVWVIILVPAFYGYQINATYNQDQISTNFSNYTDCINYWSEDYIDTCENTNERGGFIIAWEILKKSKESFIWLLVMIIPPFIIYLPFKKKWNKLYPQVSGLLARKKYTQFKPEDIIEFKGEYYCELPLFSNILLNYEVTEDFSKYLKYFEIHEHKFWYKRKPTKKNKKRRKVNESLWYARFYFKEKPLKGKIDVVFK